MSDSTTGISTDRRFWVDARKKNTGGIVWSCVGAHQQRFGARCRRYLDDIGTLPALLTIPPTALRPFSCVRLKASVPTQLVYLRHQFWFLQHRRWCRSCRARRLRYGESSPVKSGADIPCARIRRRTSALHHPDSQCVVESRSATCFTEACNCYTASEENGAGLI